MTRQTQLEFVEGRRYNFEPANSSYRYYGSGEDLSLGKHIFVDSTHVLGPSYLKRPITSIQVVSVDDLKEIGYDSEFKRYHFGHDKKGFPERFPNTFNPDGKNNMRIEKAQGKKIFEILAEFVWRNWQK